jgi:acyl-CoA thioester hydrolase
MFLEKYPIRVTLPIAWGEMDAFGHVNNIQFFKYFETARIKYFEKIKLLKMMNETGIGPILVNTSCSFKKVLKYPDEITIGARVKILKDSSFVMEYIVVNKNNEVCAEGEAVLLIFDYNINQKVNVPKNVAEAIDDLEKN